MRNVVLVHGGFVDGAGWESVYKILKRDGYSVSIVQNPTTSLEDDVAATRGTVAAQYGESILVATDDRMIPPAAQRAMSKRAGSTVVEVKGSHAIYVSQPGAVAALIEQAAKGISTAAA
jgi:hypothetical protein